MKYKNDNTFNFVKAIHINKTIINSSNIFFKNQINFVELLFESDNVCLLLYALSNILLNSCTFIFSKNLFSGKFSSSSTAIIFSSSSFFSLLISSCFVLILIFKSSPSFGLFVSFSSFFSSVLISIISFAFAPLLSRVFSFSSFFSPFGP